MLGKIVRKKSLREHGFDRQHLEAMTDDKKTPAARTRAPRLDTIAREHLIVQKAIEYFAQEGFDGSTRDLARHIGVTQSLLYKYFPNKKAIVDRVYDEVYLARWNPLWEEKLRDRTIPIGDRLKGYYLDYAKIIMLNDWVRILIFAGLKQEGINNRLFKLLRERIFTTVVSEIHHAFELPPTAGSGEEEIEIELVWALHSSIFYLGMRKWVYKSGIPKNVDVLIEALIGGLLETFKVRALRRTASKA
jgi:AcrR family transcriptional regulator